MPHVTTHIIRRSVLRMFDPTLSEYAGVREHFTLDQLERIDELRMRPDPSDFTFPEKLFICWAVNRAVMKSKNPDED